MDEQETVIEPPKKRGRPPKEVKSPARPGTMYIPEITVTHEDEYTEATFTVENKSYSEKVAIPSRHWYLMFYSRAAAQIARG